MKCIMVMFDSLNRHMLPPYNSETWVHAPNFRRLADRAVTFDTSYVCSMPCMPARRDFHTGRPNFLHRPWGPLEPFDDSVPQMLHQQGTYTHLASDHYHYWEDGGANYHTRYSSWECFRGQEGDPFVGQVAEPEIPENLNGKGRRSDWVNRQHLKTDAEMPQAKTFDAGLRFIQRNAQEDNWFLQIECFDPHEPFVTAPGSRQHYPSDYNGPVFDWPGYRDVTETPEQVEECRRNYAALMTRCDQSLGTILDAMDRHHLWDDTLLVVWTDHGFLLGEHNAWAKNWPPLYEEIAHTPFFIHDPRHPQAAGERRKALVQPAIDLSPTLLRFFGAEPTEDMLGRDLAPVIEKDESVRDAAIFGYYGNRVNITDGRYVYLRAPVEGNTPCYQYTLVPATMRGFKNQQTLAQAELAAPFSFTKGMRTLRMKGGGGVAAKDQGHLLFDLAADPAQQSTIQDEAVEERLCEQMAHLMAECDAPSEQFERMDLSQAS